MKIAVVSGFIPSPPIFGGAIDVWERIKGLTSLGHEVDLVVTEKVNPTQKQIEEIAKHTRHFFFTRRKNQIHQLFSELPLQFLSRKGLASIDINQTYDLVILESEFCWGITLNKSISYKNIVVRVHNIESHYFKMLGKSSNSLRQKIYYNLETSKIKHLSALVFDKADKLWFISKDDLSAVNLLNKSVFMPFPINDEIVVPTEKTGNNVVFMGSLFMQNNTFGLDWYLKNIHPLLIAEISDYHFYIVGSLKEEDKEIQEKYSHLPQVTFVVNAPCLKQYYQKAKVFVNPMFHGSGVKVKSVNALINGVPLVSTSVGAEGIGLTQDMYFHADAIFEFKNQILSVINNQQNAIEKTLKAQEYLKRNNYLDVLKTELNAFS
ncbi:MAG: glycosyltransferase [Myroides sp.]